MFASVGILAAYAGNGGWDTEGRRRLSVEGPEFTSVFLRTAVVVLVAVALITGTLGSLVLLLADSLPSPWVLPLLVLYACSQSMMILTRSGLLGLGSYASAAWVAGAGALALSFGVIALVLGGRLTYWTAVGLLTATSLIVSSLLLRGLCRTVPERSPEASEESLSYLRLYRDSWRAAPATLGPQIVNRGDRPLLGLVAGPYAVAVYAAGAALASIPSLVSLASSQVVQTESAADPTRRAGRHEGATVVASVVLAGILIGLAPWMVPWIFGSEYESAVLVTRIALVTSMFSSVQAMQLARRAGQAQYRSVGLNQSIGVGLTVVLVPMLGWLHGAAGAALAVLLIRILMVAFWWRLGD